MDEILKVALRGVLPGIGAALLLVGLGGRRFTALALAVGMLVAMGLLKEWPQWPWVMFPGGNGLHWLVWALVVAGIVGLLLDIDWPVRITTPLALAALAVLPWFTVTQLRARWSATDTALHVGIGAAALVALWLSLRPVVARPKGLLAEVAWTTTLAVDSWILLRSGSAYPGQLASALAAALGTVAALGWWRSSFRVGPGAALGVAAGHGGILLAGVELGELDLGPAFAALAAPAGLWLAVAGPLQGRPRLASVAAVAVTGGLLALAIATTWNAGGGGY